MEILQLTDKHQQRYENFVAAQGSGSFLQSWGWGEFQTKLGKIAVRYGIFEDDDGDNNGVGKLIAVAQLLKTKLPRLPGFYLYAPYGPVFINNEINISQYTKHFIQKINIDFPDCWFVRLESKTTLKILGQPTVHIQPGKTLVTDLTQSLVELQGAMHTKTRYNIKVAEKHGIVIESEISASPQHGFRISEFMALLTQTSTRQKFKSYDSDYYQKLIDFFVLHSRNTDCKVSLYKALYNKQLVAAAIMVDHGNTRTYLFGGSDDSFRNLMAPYALHWQAMQDAKTAGLTRYDWWGIETATGQTPGFVQFKLKWGGDQISYAGAVDVVQKPASYVIYKVLRKINRLI